MAITDPRKSLEHLEIKNFAGIKSTDRITSEGAAEMRNFRLLSDGSLQKRCGYRRWFSISAPLRGTWEGVIDGETYFFAVGGDTVYCITSKDSEPTPAAFLASSEGAVSFVYYCDRLYLLDGAELYRFFPSIVSFSVAEGYTPLYGKNWHPTELGPVHEPLNAIQNRIRIHYINSTGGTTFRLPFTMKKINSVKVGNSYVTDYLFNTTSMTVEISRASAGGVVEISATLDDLFSRRKTVLRSNQAIVYRDAHHETFLCGGGSPGYLIYRSQHVTSDMLAGSTAVFGSSDALYIPVNHTFSVGSVQHPITALLQHGEQVLVMNDQNLWAIRHLDEESDDMRIYLLRTDVGCSSRHAITMACGDPIAVTERGVYRIGFPSRDPDEATPELLSEAVTERMTPSLLQNAILYQHSSTGELWLKDPFDADAPVMIYSPSLNYWTEFDGIAATHFFEYAGQVGFSTDDGAIYLMDEALDTDNGKEIEACYVSHYLAFSHPAFQKRSLRAYLGADSHGGEIRITLECENNKHSRLFYGQDRDAPEFFDLRATVGRFRFLRFSISAIGNARTRIHFLSIAANN